MDISELIIRSWINAEGNISSTDELIAWIEQLNETTHISIKEKSIYQDTFWFYDDYNGEVLNRKRSFFSIKGMRRFENGEFVGEQPIIIQPEIGYLGIICKEIDGILNFLMQAKIEPGNINCVQISPTIQATKSNFTRTHGGKLPAYFELFENSYKYSVIYDQIQSEQATRFYKKRNRNMIIFVKEEIEVLPNFKWMTLGQIKKLMTIDNLINMDTRTVLSGLPIFNLLSQNNEEGKYIGLINNSILKSSLQKRINPEEFLRVFYHINNYKMFNDTRISTVPLYELMDWDVNEYGIVCKTQAPFMVKYYDIEIEGREVQKWSQPLFKAIGMATFGLITSIIDGERKYLVKLKPEFGSFDKAEIGSTIQWEPTHYLYDDDIIEKLFRERLEMKIGLLNDVILSEEGGRFYHEQNRNVIMDVPYKDFTVIPDGYIWVSLTGLSFMIQFNNILNIQLRNLISLINL